MKSVFIVQHSHELEDGSDETKFIGAYSTEALARDSIDRLRDQPGFSDHPNNFHIDEYELDKDHWEEGYVSLQK